MKKLEDIPKKEVFSTPDGYFDSLPTRIQSRIVEKDGKRDHVFTFQTAWKLALPAVVLLAVGIFWFTSPSQPADAESILASVQTEDLVAYLSESDISTEEVIDAAGFNTEDIDEIAGEVYDLQNIDLEGIDLDDLDLDLEN
jgi:hypothetical protein